VAGRGWKRAFDEPIALPRGGRLATLEEAGRSKLPKAEHEASEWQAAMEALILVATLGGPAMFARIGVVRALNRHTERVFNRDRKETHWGRRKLARDR
jgi:cob(I)alamin adenosyltransferase